MFDALFGSTINAIINGLNLLLFFFAALHLWRAFQLARHNRGELKLFSQRLQPLDPPSRDDLSNLAQSNSFSPGGIIRRTFDVLERLSKSSMDDRDKIYYLEDILQERRSSLPKAVPGMAVAIGFLGTVVGLLVAVVAMPGMLELDFGDSDAVEKLKQTMVVALKGMNTAFTTTLVGLGIAILLMLGNMLYQRYWAHHEHELTELLFLRLFPVFSPSEKSVTANLMNAIEHMDSNMEIIKSGNLQLTSAVSNLTDTMKNYNTEVRSLIGRISTVVEEFVASQKGNRALFDSIRSMAEQSKLAFDRIQTLLDDSIADREAMLGFLQDSRNDILEVSKTQHKAYDKSVNSALSQQTTLFENLSAQLASQHGSFFQHFEALKNSMKKEVSEESQAKVDSFKQLAAAFAAEHEQASRRRQESFEQAAQTLMTNLDSLLKTADKTMKTNLDASGKTLTGSAEKLDELLTSFKNAVFEQRNADQQETRRLIGQLAALVKQNTETFNFYQANS